MQTPSQWLALGLLLLAVSTPAIGLEDEAYQEIRVLLPTREAWKQLLASPELEVMGRGDGDLRLLSRRSLTDSLIAEGWQVEVIHPDLEAFYASLQKSATGFGPWHTYDETVAELNLLHNEFPAITTAPFSIGRTLQNREIWTIKISDDPDRDDEEPEVLFDAVHHAREIMTVELNLFYARYLCENYRVDPLVTELVEDREIFFVPIVNPDGFVHNEAIRPEGGGMWRKNRRDNGGGCFGVDNNRNYPYEWGGQGSSNSPCSDLYRGPEPVSEPENRAMVDLVNAHEFVTHNSLHSVMGSVLIPWCYTTDPTPDDSLLRTVASLLTSRNGYLFGQCPEILYTVNGGFIDWAYGAGGEREKVYSFSTEIGGSGFWPDWSERDGLLQENLPSLLVLTQIAGPAIRLAATDLFNDGGGSQIDPGETVTMTATLRNDGLLGEGRDLLILLRCDDPYVALLDASTSAVSIDPGESVTNDRDPFRFRVEEGCPDGREVPLTIEVRVAGVTRLEAPLELTIGAPHAIHANRFEDPEDGWTPDESDTAITGAFVRIEPNPTPYQPGEDASVPTGTFAWVTAQNIDEGDEDVDSGVSATRSPDFDLSGHGGVRLAMSYFHGQRDGGDDPDGDWFSIDVSPDAGASWVNLLSIRDQASPPVWRTLTVDLQDLIPLTGRVRFRVQAADGPGEGDIVEGGIDEFYLLEAGPGNAPPDPPAILSPADGETGVPGLATLTVVNATDPEGDPVTYGFRIFADTELTLPVAAADGIGEGKETTSWTVPSLLGAGTYYGRAFAADPVQRGLYGPVVSFTVTDSSAGEGGVIGGGAVLTAGPNPGMEAIRIRTLVPVSTVHRVAIHDPQGRLVRAYPEGTGGSGWREIVWDGRDHAGRPVASGSYWVRLWTPEETRTIRVVWIG